jgi:hypothetical protein
LSLSAGWKAAEACFGCRREGTEPSLETHQRQAAAFATAAAKVIEQGRQLAADISEASPVDIEFLVQTSGGYFRIVGTARGIHIMTLASRVRSLKLTGTLNVRHESPASTHPQRSAEAFS